MKRFHVNVGCADLEKSTRFYTTLFGAEPTVLKDDYAKWMLDDPRLNFSLSPGSPAPGINHLGMQADSMSELSLIQSRLHDAGEETVEQPDAECCYAASSKTWVGDPDGIAWETFVTHGAITDYGNKDVGPGQDMESAPERCCNPGSAAPCCA